MADKEYNPSKAKWPINRNEFALLGEIAFHIAFMEYHLHQVIWHLLKVTPEHGLAITGPMQLNQKLDLLMALIKQMPEKDALLTEAAQMMDKARPERNRKLHAFWAWQGPRNNNRIAIILSSNRRKFRSEPITHTDIRNARNLVFVASSLLNTWLKNNNLLGTMRVPFE